MWRMMRKKKYWSMFVFLQNELVNMLVFSLILIMSNIGSSLKLVLMVSWEFYAVHIVICEILINHYVIASKKWIQRLSNAFIDFLCNLRIQLQFYHVILLILFLRKSSYLCCIRWYNFCVHCVSLIWKYYLQ